MPNVPRAAKEPWSRQRPWRSGVENHRDDATGGDYCHAMGIDGNNRMGLTGSENPAEDQPLIGRKSVLVGILTSGLVMANAGPAVAATPAVYVPEWAPSTDYALGQQIISPNNDVVSANVAHTASADYVTDTANWTLSSTFASKATETTVASGRLSDAALAAAFGKRGEAQIVPSMTIYPTSADAYKRVHWQDATAIYAADQVAVGKIFKSTDNGVKWTAKTAVGFLVGAILRVQSTGTLIATTGAGINPTVKRSTDDGATWTTLTGFIGGALGNSSITETPSGSILFAEYGNAGATVYNVKRSTDDGATWTSVLSSPGTDPASDPGHIHSVTFDPYENRFVAFMDRPQPQVYSSSDDGATWTLLGISTTNATPNFVAPMFFKDFVAWGYDDPNQGQIARLRRADFYSGTWGNPEIVATVNPKAHYGVFPIRTGVWMLSGSTETIGGLGAAGQGSYAQEIHIIYDNGAKVAGGLSHASPLSGRPPLAIGQRAEFPARVYNVFDHSGNSWVNLNMSALPQPYTAVPYSIGNGLPMPHTTTGALGDFILPNMSAIRAKDSTGQVRAMLQMDATNRVSLYNPFSPGTPTITLYENAVGPIAFILNGAVIAAAYGDRFQISDGRCIELGNALGGNNPKIFASAVSPENVVAAPRGSLCLAQNGQGYRKFVGSGTAGWVPTGASTKIITTTSNYSAVRDDEVIVTNGASITVTLWDPTVLEGSAGRKFTVKNINAASAIVVSAGTSKTLDGAASMTLVQWAKVTLISDGTQWLTI